MFDNNISNICNYLRSCIVTWVIVISLQSKAHKIFNGASLWICNTVECVWWLEHNLVQQTCRCGASFLSSNDLKILIYYISAERDWRSRDTDWVFLYRSWQGLSWCTWQEKGTRRCAQLGCRLTALGSRCVGMFGLSVYILMQCHSKLLVTTSTVMVS